MPSPRKPEHSTSGGLNILAATDGSATGNAAVAWAVSVFGSANVSLRVVHVIEHRRHDADSNDPINDALRTIVAGVGGDMEAIETAVLPHGAAWESIRDNAESFGADLLVLGARGHSPFEWMRLGTTTRRLIRTAPCPILTIPPSHALDADAPIHGLVGVDFSEESSRAISAAVRLLDATGCGGTLTLLHVCETLHMPYEGMGYSPSAVTDELVKHRKVEAGHLLDGLAADATSETITVNTRIEAGHAATLVLEVASQLGCSFVATGTRGSRLMHRLFLGSVATHLLQAHSIPVLTTRDIQQEQLVPLSAHAAEKVSS
ncbi:MAG: universal stress protein [Planctomycetes bacterium]|jgi:nucleotide-binding universal stress UspA family protein|nr:universal stress protein [Planctomycetota bacterium]MCP4839981.1 universal stress protein [Planctomycetota bacterium]